MKKIIFIFTMLILNIFSVDYDISVSENNIRIQKVTDDNYNIIIQYFEGALKHSIDTYYLPPSIRIGRKTFKNNIAGVYAIIFDEEYVGIITIEGDGSFSELSIFIKEKYQNKKIGTKALNLFYKKFGSVGNIHAIIDNINNISSILSQYKSGARVVSIHNKRITFCYSGDNLNACSSRNNTNEESRTKVSSVNEILKKIVETEKVDDKAKFISDFMKTVS